MAFDIELIRESWDYEFMFSRLDVIEKAGTGITRIKKAMKGEGLPTPRFEDMGKFFKITLLRPETTQKRLPEKVTQKGYLKVGDSSLKILDILRINPKATLDEMANALGISRTAIKKNLDSLKDKNLVRRLGPPKGGSWEVIE